MNARDAFPAVATAPLRVLMVEDDRNDAALIQAYLAEDLRAGAVVRHVRTLAEGLEHAREAQVTLLDLDLPDSSGLATLERMRSATTGPLIVISGNGHPKLLDEALRRRAFDVIPKHQLDAATLRRVMRLAAQQAQSSHAQRASESRYRALVESSSEALVLLDAYGRVEYASAAMRRVLGFETSDVLGRYGLEFVQPEDRAAVQSAFRELHGSPGACATLRVRFRHKDGGERVLESTLANRLDEPDVAAVVCSYRDLTREEEHRARFVATFETSPVGLAHVDPEGRILIANQRLCDMLGYAREELVGRTIRELSHPEDLDATAEQRAQLRAGELPQFSMRKRYLRKDGETVWVQLTVSLERDAEGRPKYDIACFEDISEAMRDELAAKRVRRMYAALSATNEATLKSHDAQTLYRRVCELLVEHGGLKLAAVRLVDAKSQWIETAAHAGEPEAYLQGARVSIDRERPELQGPTVRTVVEDQTIVSNDYLGEPALARWHASARVAGIAAMMSVPLCRGGRTIGLLALYAAERDWFDPELVALAERMAENVSFALDNLDREAARRTSEERFRALTEMSSDFYWETDTEHRFTLRGSGTRPSSQATFGEEAWLGKARWELPYLSPDAAGWAAHRSTLDAHLPFRDFVFSRPCPEAGERFIMVSGDPVFGAAGQFAGYRGIGTDVTEQRSAQQILELEHAVARHLATAESEGEGVLAMMRTICSLFGWEQGRYWRVDGRGGVLRCGAYWNAKTNTDEIPAAMRGLAFRPGEGMAGHVWRSGEPLWAADASADPRNSAPALAAAPLRAAFLFPVRAEGKTLGVFTFGSDAIRPPNERLLKAVGVIGGQIGLFLQRKRSEEAQRRFRAGMDASADMILLIDPRQMRYVDVNEAVCRTLGYSREEMIAMGPQDLLPIAREELQGVYEKFIANPASIHGMVDTAYRCKDGSLVPFESTRQLLDTEDGPLIVAISRDIRDRLAAERALRDSEARFRSLTGLSSDWYWEQDAQYRFTVLSGPGAASLADGEVTQYLGKTRWDTPDLEPMEGGWEAHRALLERREKFHEVVLRRRFADGSEGYMSVSGEPVFDAEGRFSGYRGVAKDITEKMRAERALRESESRFRSLTELSADWYWEQDAELRFVSTGGQDRARGGITAAQHDGLRRWELPGTEPLEGGWDEHKAVLAARRPFRDFMLRRRGNDGGIHYVSVSGEPVFGEDGAFRGYRGVAKDVTDRLRDEDRLRMSHERFEIVSRATNDVVWDWNLETDEIWWNENFRQLYGYALEEVGTHSDSWTSRIHLEDLARVKSEVEAAIAGGAKSWAGEYRFRRRDGSYADVYDRGLLIHDGQGRAVRMIGAMMDISERKRAESRMRAHAQRQEAVAGFGQFALGRRSPEELYAAAAQALRCAGVDASVAVEMVGDTGEYLLRAAQGDGPHAVVGQRGKLSPDSVWPDIQREHTSRIAGRSYLSTRPAELPWGAWVRTMGSAVYSPVREGDRPVGMLCVYAANEHAFGAEDARFVDSVSHVLSTALQRHKAEQRLAHLAQFDALTGLPNRTLLQDRLDQTIVQSRRKRWHAGVLFVDLDRFKLINDSLGHHLGDALIREVGQRLLSSVRPGDTVGRISGDEFAVVLADLARPDDAALVAQKVLDALGQPFDLAGNEAYVTASIGIAAFPEDGEDAETLIKNADMAMYRAKESARNSYCFFTAEMNQRTVAKVQLSADLRRAIERQEFALHYQPKIALETGELRGMEALLRWNHPARGMVSPAEFVPSLEDSGLILPVGEWVIAEACAQIRRWELAGLAPVPIAVNLSAKQFLRRDLDKTITHALAAAGVPPRLLELEITESCLMHSPEEAIRVLNALRDAGLKISVDDFGTGYSSLAYLARFPLSALKIDRAFVRNVHSDSSAAAIVRAVIDMANNLELQVIAEGVETEQQAAFLRGHGCHQGQGYLFSRPVPAEVVGARLRPAH
jgi:diguanylate cyclase (GGDEF)-like protein/PAS domain S-box-containing protein